MLIPFNTDAPIYHRPFGTISLIAINILVYIAVSLHPQLSNSLYLPHGQSFTPARWLTSLYLHQDIGHLVGNMFFLWAFGLIVEGKVGTTIFLGLYHFIGIFQSLIEQLIFYRGEAIGSFGASAAIFGLLAICLIWAPRNEFSTMLWVVIRPVFFEISVMWFALFYLGFCVFNTIINWPQTGSDFLHLLGAVIGASIGYVMLKKNLVDCEGWDLFSNESSRQSQFSNGYTHTIKRDIERRSHSKKVDSYKQKKSKSNLSTSSISKNYDAKYYVLIQNEKWLAAYLELQTVRIINPKFRAETAHLISIARAMRKNRDWKSATACYEEAIRSQPDLTSERLELAEIYSLIQERPSAAKKLIQDLNESALTETEQTRLVSLRKTIQKQIHSGVIEIDYNDR